MSSRSIPPCDHELRPGTAVCLRCQHAERAARRARQRQIMARGTAVVMVLGVIAAIGIAGASVIRNRGWTEGTETLVRSAEPQANSATDSATDATASPTTDSTPTMPVPQRTAGSAAAPAAMASSQPTAARVKVAPVVPVGGTALRDSMVADRAGDTVRVRFDLELSRTRRPEKFEAIVRSTLPQVYGAAVDSALRALPEGAVARAGDLVTTLPEQGFHIPLPGGRTIAVWPETRPGRDGPLVVAYRAVASP
jgi:hypothetical protein